jgi:hypothetical protein
LAIAIGAIGAGTIDSLAGCVGEEKTVRTLLFLRSVSGSLWKFAGKLKPLIHCPAYIPIKRGRKQ